MNNIYSFPDKVFIFDIIGRYAHFRKFYTNSTSLSYLTPPRTVLTGLIAGMLGLPSERFTDNKNETYYEKFNSDKFFVAVSMRTKIRKMMQTVNYCFTKTQNNQILFSKHSQIPLEILTAQDEEELRYRVYFSFIQNEDKTKYEKEIELIKQNRFVYPPYLGLSEFIASICYIDEGKLILNKQPKELNTICKMKLIKGFDFENKVKYLTERMPVEFSKNRTPLSTADYLIEVNAQPIIATFKEQSPIFKIEYIEKGKSIMENISPL